MNHLFEQAFSMQGRVALITGGGSGLGLAIARSLHAAGAQVVLTGRREELLQEACKELGERAAYEVSDVSLDADCKALAKKVLDTYGRIDVLVNNAGKHVKKPVEQLTREDFQGILDVHLLGSFFLTQAFLPMMRAQKSGSILFISSMAATNALTQVAAYSAPKTGMLGLVRSLAGEVSIDGIRVNAILPGFIDTPMFRKATDTDPARYQKIMGHTPMARAGQPMDIGWAALYLAAPASQFVTGTTLVVDGGFSVGF